MRYHEQSYSQPSCVGFSAREGIAISTVTYNDNGTVRPLFYRLSLSEMVVPYAEVIP